ncbi:MAG: transcriptional regulator, LuxR family [Solirubrobacterales bacterium]|jgi:two-component system response regulator DesR|nr:transcriptional regulator, LuxR family [Solirubrobacterales bacterium]
MPATVALARFEDLIARGLTALIDDDPNLELVAADLDAERLRATLRRQVPDVALLNYGSLITPFEVHELHAAHPQTRLVVLANGPTAAEANQLLTFGATACLSKQTQARDVLNAIHLASRGLQVLPRATAGEPLAVGPTGPEPLTAREGDVLALLQEGRSNAQIAVQLQVGVETVRTHARNIYRKLGVRTRRELIRRA